MGTHRFGNGLDPDCGSILLWLQLWLELSIWIVIVSQHGQYADCAVLSPLSPPAVRFAIDPILIDWL
jgi:hypothetical protein